MLADQFWRDGFLHIPRFFAPDEVLKWREAAMARGSTLADLLSDPLLQEIVFDPRLLALSREILGADPVYFGDATTAIGYNGWGFHKDNSDRLDGNAPDWQTDQYPLLRFGIYCQDHDPEPGGLELRRGSHLIADYTSGEYVTPAIRVGDLIVWNFRTSHSAGVRHWKMLGSRLPHGKWMERLDRRIGFGPLTRKAKTERVGIFLTLAKDDPLLQRHIDYLKQRAFAWGIWGESHWQPDVWGKAKDAGLKLIDLTQLEYDGREVHVAHHPIPY